MSPQMAHRDRISYKDLTSAFGAKRNWAARQSPPPRSEMTLNGHGRSAYAVEDFRLNGG
jgi:hypothetical protein